MASDRIVDRLRTDEALAQWRAAAAFLDRHDGLVVPALEDIRSLVGHGLADREADLLADMVRTVRAEREASL